MQTARVIILAAVVAAVTVLVVQRRAIWQLRAENELLRQEQTNRIQSNPEDAEHPLRTMDRQLVPATNGTSAEVHRLHAAVAQLRRQVQQLTQAREEAEETLIVAADWSKRRGQLHDWLEQEPLENTPELRLATSDDWVRAVLFNPLKTDEDYRRAMSLMRANAAQKLINILFPALREYVQAHDGRFPAAVTELQPYCTTPLEEAILARYEVLPAHMLRGLINDGEALGFKDWVITERAPINQTWDDRWFMGLTNILGTTRVSAPNRWGSTR